MSRWHPSIHVHLFLDHAGARVRWDVVRSAWSVGQQSQVATLSRGDLIVPEGASQSVRIIAMLRMIADALEIDLEAGQSGR